MSIKSFTDLQQSKKLAEILSPKSADMFYIAGKGEPVFIGNKMVAYGEDDYDCLGGPDILCWSLASLLAVLPKGYSLGNKKSNGKYYICMTCIKHGVIEYDEPIDACVAVIERLHELNLL